MEHHLAHASAAYFTSPWREDKALVLTCDGSGDRLSATVSIGDNGELRRIAEVSEHDSIGRLYALVTRYLGMAPLEHEYKVMGLAPCCRQRGEGCERGRSVSFAVRIHAGSAGRGNASIGVPSMYGAYALLRKMLQNQRFDWIAAGAQYFVEQMLTQWVRNAVRETGITKIACSGGVFMNVKANLALLELPEVEDMYVFPSCGDESNSIGAACLLAAEAGDRMQQLGPIYYGDPITDSEADQALMRKAHTSKFNCRYVSKIEELVAQKLADGKDRRAGQWVE